MSKANGTSRRCRDRVEIRVNRRKYPAFAGNLDQLVELYTEQDGIRPDKSEAVARAVRDMVELMSNKERAAG